MTTPNEELIARLRDRATFLGPELTLAILPEAADLLQSQAEHIAILESLNELAVKQAETLVKQRDTLRAQLAEIAATEPVSLATDQTDEFGEVIYREVFTRPMPAESKDAERYRWLRDYLISPSTHFDDLIVSADKADTLDGVIDAARAKGAKL